LLLIAVAIQGATPDAQDLASLNTIMLLCPDLMQSGKMADSDCLPDEVAATADCELDAVVRASSKPASPVGYLSLYAILDDLHSIPPGFRQAGVRELTALQQAKLLHSLCRLRC
jgi:hypothetical protein